MYFKLYTMCNRLFKETVNLWSKQICHSGLLLITPSPGDFVIWAIIWITRSILLEGSIVIHIKWTIQIQQSHIYFYTHGSSNADTYSMLFFIGTGIIWHNLNFQNFCIQLSFTRITKPCLNNKILTARTLWIFDRCYDQ